MLVPKAGILTFWLDLFKLEDGFKWQLHFVLPKIFIKKLRLEKSNDHK